MSKNLFDYADTAIEDNEKTETKVNEEFVRNKVSEYSKMSQSEMLSKLLGEVENAKRNGAYDYEKISSSIESVRQYLTPEQQKNLELLLKRIR